MHQKLANAGSVRGEPRAQTAAASCRIPQARRRMAAPKPSTRAGRSEQRPYKRLCKRLHHAKHRCRARYIAPLQSGPNGRRGAKHDRRELAAAERVVEVVLRDFAAQGVAMDAERLGGAALIAAGMFQDAADEFLLELSHGLFEQNAAIDHHTDQRIQFLFHVCMLRNEASQEASPSQSSAWPVMR